MEMIVHGINFRMSQLQCHNQDIMNTLEQECQYAQTSTNMDIKHIKSDKGELYTARTSHTTSLHGTEILKGKSPDGEDGSAAEELAAHVYSRHSHHSEGELCAAGIPALC